MSPRSRPRVWRGLKALVHDAVDATTDLVREGHASTHRSVWRVADQVESLATPVGAVQGVVEFGTYGVLSSVKAVNRVIEALTDFALEAGVSVDPQDAAPIPLRSDALGTRAWIADASLGALNGALGSHLAARDNALDLGMQLRVDDRYLDGTESLRGPLVVLIHGLGTTEWCWSLDAEAYHGDPAATFGSMLARDLGETPVYARYNTGRRVGESGRALADALEAAFGPGVERIVLLGHSMGGLVALAACHAASESGHPWVRSVDLVISLGTPHQGAPLARFGQSTEAGLDAIDLPTTRILARILAGRSAGIRDLEHGEILGSPADPDATAPAGDRAVPWLDGVRYAFLSATVHADPEHPASVWLGDLLVRRASASGPVEQAAFQVHLEPFGGVLHHQFQCHPAVYEQVRLLVGGGTREDGADRSPPPADRRPRSTR